MFQVVISKAADKHIKRYVELYTDHFQELFSDTGIWSEEMIQRNYEISGEELFRSVYALIREKFSQEILPHSVTENTTRSTTLTLGHRRIALEYEESENIRIITDIKIWYKH